jgi:retron-type reverse transcriptase
MHKKIKNAFYTNLTFEKILQAHHRAKKHKTYKAEIIKFELNLENNLINIINQLKNHTYHLGKYYTFKIYEPKEREIKALPYKDRIVHQWYVEEFIKPYILPRFINTSFACITNKGTHKAVNTVQSQMRIFKRNNGDFWVLKCDIKKFFYSINPCILFDIMKKYIADKDVLYLTQILIFNGDINTSQVGIPIRQLY